MPKPYDDAMKKLVAVSPQDFLSWLYRDAVYERQLPYELNHENIYADGLIEARHNGKRMLVHLEFQSSYDQYIGERLLEYNVLASRQYGRVSVRSFVIYLKDCGNIPQSPFISESPDGEEVVRFKYNLIELHKLNAAELLEKRLFGLLPLLPLTKDGARREIVDDMIANLVETERTESLWIGYALAAKVMHDDLRWLKWRFSMLSDFLRDSPVFQEVLEEGMEKGMEKGIEKGMEKGIEKGREEELQKEIQRERDALLDIIFDRFPELFLQGKEVSRTIDDPATLLRLMVKMSTIPTAEEARQLLLALAQ